jgi:malate dehydrogenase (oxaloacetate-decarboxylating)
MREHQIVFVGAGSAAMGVADYLRFAMIDDGISDKEARARFWVIDKDGLLDSNRRDLSDAQKTYARDSDEVKNWPRNSHGQIGLSEAIAQLDATILIGLSTVKGIFSESVVREMAKRTERPIIFPLSNPTSRSEAEPADLIEWTEGRALVATGSPFAPVKYQGRSIDIAQCNNVFIFPAVGLGLLASKARRVSDRMMMAAAKALGDQSPALKDPAASLLPNVRTIRDVAREVAYAVAAQANGEGLAPEFSPQKGRQTVAENQWTPEYLGYSV